MNNADMRYQTKMTDLLPNIKFVCAKTREENVANIGNSTEYHYKAQRRSTSNLKH